MRYEKIPAPLSVRRKNKRPTSASGSNAAAPRWMCHRAEKELQGNGRRGWGRLFELAKEPGPWAPGHPSPNPPSPRSSKYLFAAVNKMYKRLRSHQNEQQPAGAQEN
uniref:Uncharacterized protein n=1 Tax=Globodera rostochiensis TaxID=31243 RepID=A0A914H9S1_GLORO